MAQNKPLWTDGELAYAEPAREDELPRPFLAPRRRAGSRHGKVYRIAKRIFDVVASACLLAVIWPVFIVIAVLIKLDSAGPVFYRHRRIGQNGKEIYIYKFRSMVENAESLIARFTPEQKEEWAANYKLDEDPRITRIGKFLRRTSLDELPQIVNILQGSLSVVGPRPVIRAELEKYGETAAMFLSTKPGLTGYWQAYARSDCTYEERMEMELFYVGNASAWFDTRVLFRTVKAVLLKSGAK